MIGMPSQVEPPRLSSSDIAYLFSDGKSSAMPNRPMSVPGRLRPSGMNLLRRSYQDTFHIAISIFLGWEGWLSALNLKKCERRFSVVDRPRGHLASVTIFEFYVANHANFVWRTSCCDFRRIQNFSEF